MSQPAVLRRQPGMTQNQIQLGELIGLSPALAVVLAAVAAIVVVAAAELLRARAPSAAPRRRRVVVVGGGFGGLQAVRHLRGAGVDVALIDRRNFHLFQPLAYQVATGALAAGEIATPLRAIFKRRGDVRVVLGEVTDFDLDRRRVGVAADGLGSEPLSIPYDTLIVAAGSQYSYFGHEDWRELAPELKSLESALEVRRRILAAFEAAELEHDPERRAAWLTFAIVGAGPTGVEMAGQIAEIARDTLRRDFRTIDPGEARVLLIDQGDRALATYPPSLSAKAERGLERLGVTPLMGWGVVGIDEDGVTLRGREGRDRRTPARTVIWAAGVHASPLAAELAAASGAQLDAAGRVLVAPDLSLPGRPEVLVIGDMVRPLGPDGAPVALPGVAPVAMQQGRYAARLIRARLRGRTRPPFRYRNKGDVATVGRAHAVADLPGVHLSGFPAWLFWLGLHLYYLVGFQNRILVLTRWAFSFVTRGRGARLMTGTAATGSRAARSPGPGATAATIVDRGSPQRGVAG